MVDEHRNSIPVRCRMTRISQNAPHQSYEVTSITCVSTEVKQIHAHYLVWVVDFVKSQSECQRCQYGDHDTTASGCLQHLFNLTTVSLKETYKLRLHSTRGGTYWILVHVGNVFIILDLRVLNVVLLRVRCPMSKSGRLACHYGDKLEGF